MDNLGQILNLYKISAILRKISYLVFFYMCDVMSGYSVYSGGCQIYARINNIIVKDDRTYLGKLTSAQ